MTDPSLRKREKGGPAAGQAALRFAVYCAGALILALGLVLNAKTGLGVTAILSVPYTVNRIVPSLSFGTCTTILYALFVLAQAALLRTVGARMLLQLPFSFVFGRLIDMYDAMIGIKDPSCAAAAALLACAIALTALGVVLMVSMDLLVNPGDGIVQAFAKKTGKRFGTVKLLIDASMLLVTLALCALFAHGIAGVGIGTFAAAGLIGPLVNVFDRLFRLPLQKAAGVGGRAERKAN